MGFVGDVYVQEVILEALDIVAEGHHFVAADTVRAHPLWFGRKALEIPFVYQLAGLGMAIGTGHPVETGMH
jgi:hypothetical protein